MAFLGEVVRVHLEKHRLELKCVGSRRAALLVCFLVWWMNRHILSKFPCTERPIKLNRSTAYQLSDFPIPGVKVKIKTRKIVNYGWLLLVKETPTLIWSGNANLSKPTGKSPINRLVEFNLHNSPMLLCALAAKDISILIVVLTWRKRPIFCGYT